MLHFDEPEKIIITEDEQYERDLLQVKNIMNDIIDSYQRQINELPPRLSSSQRNFKKKVLLKMKIMRKRLDSFEDFSL